MKRRLTFGNVILCDFVSRGEGNKSTIVNSYSGDVVVGDLPVQLLLSLYSEFIPTNELRQEMTFLIKFEGKTIVEARMQADFGETNAASVIALPLFPVNVAQEGLLTIVVSSRGYVAKTILQKKIIKAPISPSLATA